MLETGGCYCPSVIGECPPDAGGMCGPGPCSCAGYGPNVCALPGYYCHTPSDSCENDGDCSRGLSCVYNFVLEAWACQAEECPE
jgi:hypothetical protein